MAHHVIEKCKKRRIELKVERTKGAQRREAWMHKHGHDTYGDDSGDDSGADDDHDDPGQQYSLCECWLKLATVLELAT